MAKEEVELIVMRTFRLEADRYVEADVNHNSIEEVGRLSG